MFGPGPIRLLLQVPLSLAILAWVPGNAWKLAALVLLWGLTFGRISKAEWRLLLGICIFFSAMNAAALHQGIFRFNQPDVLGLPWYEWCMWGFYLLHTIRVLAGAPPTTQQRLAWTLAVVYAAAFALIADAHVLLAVTAGLLVCALFWFPTCVGMGAIFEFEGRPRACPYI